MKIKNTEYNIFIVDHIGDLKKEMIYNLNEDIKVKKNKTKIRDREIYFILDDLRIRLTLNDIDYSFLRTYNIVVEYNDIVILHDEYLSFSLEGDNNYLTEDFYDILFNLYQDQNLTFYTDKFNIHNLTEFKNRVFLEINKMSSKFYGYNANSIIFPENEDNNIDKLTQDEKDEFIDEMIKQELDNNIIDYIDQNLKAYD